jgi:hypothetical protein
MSVAIIWAALRPRCAFVVRIRDGVPRVAAGTLTRAFLQEIEDTCARHALRAGVVRGVARNGRIALAFSRSISPPCRQQLRNLWTLKGWSTSERRPQTGR